MLRIMHAAGRDCLRGLGLSGGHVGGIVHLLRCVVHVLIWFLVVRISWSRRWSIAV
jgi:hypothetical protein